VIRNAVQVQESAKPVIPPSSSPPPQNASVEFSSDPEGADIYIDGNFSGNTPSELQVPDGEHLIAVKKAGFKAWERKLRVSSGSSVRLNAELEKTANP